MGLKSGIVLLLAIGAVVAVDYCKNMRCAKKPHVACNSPAANDGWGPDCSDDRELIKMTPELISRIVEIHNKQRNQQALGKTPNYGPASRMGTLVWDDGLAKMAEYNARLCRYEHDSCHNTKKWYPSGQNIAQTSSRPDDKEVIESLVPIWFENEAQNGYVAGWMDMINSFSIGNDPNVEVGHFTQVVWEDAAVVGCAGVKYNDAGGPKSNLICNYGFGNMAQVYVYQSGPAASKCETGPNPKYPGLCSESENYTDSILNRSGWSLKPKTAANGGMSWSVPNGCDDDVECRKMQADPTAYFKQFLKPEDIEPTATFLPNGRVHFNFPGGCDQTCHDNFMADFMKKHPEYGK